MGQAVFNRAWVLNALTNQMGAAPLDAMELHLFKNNFTPSKTSVLADFVEAAFVGYAVVPVFIYYAPFCYQNVPAGQLDGGTFYASAPAVEITYGWFLTDGTGALVAAANWDTPPILVANNDAVSVQILFALDKAWSIEVLPQ